MVRERAPIGSPVDSLAGMVLTARRALGLTQQQMADRMGISRSQVANIEAARGDTSAAGLVPVLIEAGMIAAVPERAARQADAVHDAHEAVQQALNALAEASARLQRVKRPEVTR